MPQLGEVKRAHELGKKGFYKYIWHACIDCGKERWVLVKSKGSQLPRSLRCYDCGTRKALWKGGKTRQGKGYIGIKLYPSDFFYSMAHSGGYVLEHRLVMAKYLNRCLLPWEIVHHKNHIKNDNRIENLKLITDKRFHLVDAKARNYIKRLQGRIAILEGQLRDFIMM